MESGRVTRSQKAAAIKAAAPSPREALAEALIVSVRQDASASGHNTVVVLRDLLQVVSEAIGKALKEANAIVASQSAAPSSSRAEPLPGPVAGPSWVHRVVSKPTVESADDAEGLFRDTEGVEVVEDTEEAGGVEDAEGEVEGE